MTDKKKEIRGPMGTVGFRKDNTFYTIDISNFSGHYEDVRDVLYELSYQDKDINSDTVATEIAKQKHTYTSLTVKVTPQTNE